MRAPGSFVLRRSWPRLLLGGRSSARAAPANCAVTALASASSLLGPVATDPDEFSAPHLGESAGPTGPEKNGGQNDTMRHIQTHIAIAGDLLTPVLEAMIAANPPACRLSAEHIAASLQVVAGVLSAEHAAELQRQLRAAIVQSNRRRTCAT